MTFRFKIIEGFEPPPFKENYRKPPIKKSKYTEKEKVERRKIAQLKQNSKRTKEYNKIQNDKQRARTDEKRKASIEKANANRLIIRNKKLEKLARRTKPLNCEVCGDTEKICFDHCHKNNHFRGWICDRCNKILGLAKDKPDLLNKLKIYLEKDMIENLDKYE